MAALREMHMTPAFEDVADQLVEPYVRPALDDRSHMPIPEAMAGRSANGDRVAVTANDDARLDRIDGCTVARGDVDAEVKRGERTFGVQMEARIAERAAN